VVLDSGLILKEILVLKSGLNAEESVAAGQERKIDESHIIKAVWSLLLT
jgi:hypothetical protein